MNKFSASEQTVYKHQISPNKVCAINMLTEKMARIYNEKLPYVHIAKGMHTVSFRQSLLYYRIRNGINSKDQESAGIGKHYPKSN